MAPAPAGSVIRRLTDRSDANLISDTRLRWGAVGQGRHERAESRHRLGSLGRSGQQTAVSVRRRRTAVRARANQRDVELDGFVNYHWLTSPGGLGLPKVMLEAGINAPAEVVGPDRSRRALIAIRSSPWKAGHETNPWHDEFDLDHGHVRYFGDHKPSTVGLPGETKGNRLLLEAARLHAGTTRDERPLAPPLFLSCGHCPSCRSSGSERTCGILRSRDH